MPRPMKYTGVRLEEYQTALALRKLVFTKREIQEIVVGLNRRQKRSNDMIAKTEKKRKVQEAQAIVERIQRRAGIIAPLGNELIRMGGEQMKTVVALWLKRLPRLFTIRATYGTTSKDITKDSDVPNDEWFLSGHWWKLMLESDTTVFNNQTVARLEYIPTNTVTGNPGTQRMREGDKHCIFDKLKTFFQYKLENTKSEKKIKEFGYCIRKCDTLAEKYNEGITLDDLEKEIKCLQVTVYVYRIDNSVKRILNPRGDYRYNFLNNRFNHCETLLSDTATEELTLTKMKRKIDDLVESNTEFRYEQGKTFIKRIMTADKCYKLKMPYDDLFKEFNTTIEREFYDIDYVKEAQLFEYIQEAGNHNTHMRFQNVPNDTELKEVDCKAGYTQFKQAPVYKGFLGCVWDFCGPVSLETVFKQIGIYTVRVKSVHPRYARHFRVNEKYTLTSPLIEFLSNHQMNGKISFDFTPRVSFEVIHGVYGSKFDMEFPAEFMDKCCMKTGILYKAGEVIPKDADAKPLYSLWVGATASVSTHRKICSQVDYKLVQEYNNDGIIMDWVYANECYEYVNGVRTLRERVQEMESPPGYGVQYLQKETSSNCPQIFAFITDYMRQNMLYEMERIDEADIYAWKVDSIVYKGKYKFRDIFRQKKVKNDFTMSSHIFRNSDSCGEFCEIVNTNTIFTGAGGTGKSEYASKMRKLMYVAPMWSMNADFFLKYHCYATTPQRLFGIDCRPLFETSKYRPGTIYFDEATMIDEATKQKALSLNKHIRVIFGGDFDDKGRPFQTVFQTCMNLNGLTHKPFTTDYRSAEGDTIREIKQKIRAFMYANYGDSKKLVEYVKSLLPNNIVSKDYVIENYNVKDWVLASTIANKDKWTELLKHKGEKYYVTKHSEQDIHKAFNGENCALKGHIIYEDNNRCEIRHGFTIHSAQGKTITENIYIDLDKMDFDYCLLYTAISRAKRLSQIYLI
jgi:hypothetical protein